MALALDTHDLSKRFRVGRRSSYTHLTEMVTGALTRPFRRGDPDARNTGYVWALKDVSLEVEEGQVLGVIGRNGAGKTTLLKIISRITEPTSGYADIRGRVGSLLEVGTGFHPELTGRENVYLNGAILGMRKTEIDRKFDEIVDFAEVGGFLDTPVKFYSSGMYVRLGFSVAAYLDSDILLLDEVLAVGDHRFQQKCLETMRRVGQTGSTVIFISHNLAAIRSLCTSCVWIEKGRIVDRGPAERCVQDYLGAISDTASALAVSVAEAERPPGLGATLRFTNVHLESEYEDDKLRRNDPIRITLRFDASVAIENLALGIHVYSADGALIMQCLNTHSGQPYSHVRPGHYSVEMVVPDNVLVEGRYVLGITARDENGTLDSLRDPLEFEVVEREPAASWLDLGQLGVVRIASTFGPLRFIDGDLPSGAGRPARG